MTVDLADYKHHEDNKKPEFLAKFPLGKIPAFETKDGFKLFEGASIANYSTYMNVTLGNKRSSSVVRSRGIGSQL